MAKTKFQNLRDKSWHIVELVFSKKLKTQVQQVVPFWIASLLVGLIAVGYTKLFGMAETLLQFSLAGNQWIIFIIAPVCFIMAWLIVIVFAPNAAGSGIPQVMASLELATPGTDYKVKSLLSLRVMFTKIASSLLMVLGGGAVGREGPTIQIAGSVFRFVNKIIPASWPKLSRQSFILTGAAAGLAAAFNTPLGGIVFAIEELARMHVRHFRTALFTAVIIAGLTAQAFLGPYLYLGYPNVKGLGLAIYVAVAGTALLSGMFGSLMGKIILQVMAWKRNFSKGRMLLFIIIIGLLVASLSYFIDDTVLGSGKEIMNDALFEQHKPITATTVLLRFIGPVLAFNTGAAGGIFAPALAAGAAVGGYLSSLFDFAGANANIIILSGMVGFLTGVTRTPFTSAILVLEMTDRHSVIFHLMLAAMLSNIGAFLVEKESFYGQLKKRYVEDALADPEAENKPKVDAATP